LKRLKLIKEIKGMGCVFIRHGGEHDWYKNVKTRVSQPIPRHVEIEDRLAKHIIKKLRD
jgi:mRNA interferase HicA